MAVATDRYLPQPPSPQMVIEILSSIVDAQLLSCEVRERTKMEDEASAVQGQGCRSNKVQGVEVVK